jgi:hypothetical protein
MLAFLALSGTAQAQSATSCRASAARATVGAAVVARLLPKAASQPTAEEPAETIDTSQQVLHEA